MVSCSVLSARRDIQPSEFLSLGINVETNERFGLELDENRENGLHRDAVIDRSLTGILRVCLRQKVRSKTSFFAVIMHQLMLGELSQMIRRL